MSDSSTQPFFQELDSDLPIKEASITAASQWIHQCLESDPTQIPGYAEFADCKILLADLVERCISFGAGVYSDVVSRRDSLVKSGDNLGWTRYEIIVLRG